LFVVVVPAVTIAARVR